MQAQRKRNIRDGKEYASFFPPADNNTSTVKANAGVSDTVSFIPEVVHATISQTKRIADKLHDPDLYRTCRNIWEFVYNHIAYSKDKEGFEQIRSPARVWADRFSGVDCDCYTTFISSILTNLGIRHKLRITKYHKDYFQHIYPIVPFQGGHITLDCVTDRFDYEVGYSEKKDYAMELQYLHGFDSERGDDLVFNGDMGELGLFGKKRKKAAAAAALPADPNAIPASGVKKKKGLKKLFSKINKVNPATVILRTGVLAAMKLNMFKVASRLRWSYISPNEAAKRNIDPAKYNKLVSVRQKLENTFDGAGGKIKNLKKAILTGKGNKDKAVPLSGLDGFASLEDVGYLHPEMSLSQLLGSDIYNSELVDEMDGFEGFGALGEPITGATLAAATAVIGSIATLLKSVGNIFKGGKGEGSADFDEGAIATAEAQTPAAIAAASPGTEISDDPVTATASSTPTSLVPIDNPQSSSGEEYAEDYTATDLAPSSARMAVVQNSAEASPLSTGGVSPATPPAADSGFWAKNKKWLLPTAIGVGAIAAIVVGVKLLKPAPVRSTRSLNGPPKKKHRRPHKHGKKAPVALL